MIPKCTFQCNHNVVPSPTEWGPLVISWFITPSKYSYLRIIHYGYYSFLHQLSVHELGPWGPFPCGIFLHLWGVPWWKWSARTSWGELLVAWQVVTGKDVFLISPYNLTQGTIFGVKNGEVILRYTKYGRVSSGSKFGKKLEFWTIFPKSQASPRISQTPDGCLPTLRTPKATTYCWNHSQPSEMHQLITSSKKMEDSTPPK